MYEIRAIKPFTGLTHYYIAHNNMETSIVTLQDLLDRIEYCPNMIIFRPSDWYVTTNRYPYETVGTFTAFSSIEDEIPELLI